MPAVQGRSLHVSLQGHCSIPVPCQAIPAWEQASQPAGKMLVDACCPTCKHCHARGEEATAKACRARDLGRSRHAGPALEQASL